MMQARMRGGIRHRKHALGNALMLSVLNLNILNMVRVSGEVSPEEAIRLYQLNPAIKTLLSVNIKRHNFNRIMNNEDMLSILIHSETMLTQFNLIIEELLDRVDLHEKHQAYLETLREFFSQNPNQKDCASLLQNEVAKTFDQIIKCYEELLNIYRTRLTIIENKIKFYQTKIDALSPQVVNNFLKFKKSFIKEVDELDMQSSYSFSFDYQGSFAALPDVTIDIDIKQDEIKARVKEMLSDLNFDIKSLDDVDFKDEIRELLIEQVKAQLPYASVDDLGKVIKELLDSSDAKKMIENIHLCLEACKAKPEVINNFSGFDGSRSQYRSLQRERFKYCYEKDIILAKIQSCEEELLLVESFSGNADDMSHSDIEMIFANLKENLLDSPYSEDYAAQLLDLDNSHFNVADYPSKLDLKAHQSSSSKSKEVEHDKDSDNTNDSISPKLR